MFGATLQLQSFSYTIPTQVFNQTSDHIRHTSLRVKPLVHILHNHMLWKKLKRGLSSIGIIDFTNVTSNVPLHGSTINPFFTNKWKFTWVRIDEHITWHPMSGQLWRSSWMHLLVKRTVQPTQRRTWLWHWRFASTTIRSHTFSRAYLCGAPKGHGQTHLLWKHVRYMPVGSFTKGENTWTQQLFGRKWMGWRGVHGPRPVL